MTPETVLILKSNRLAADSLQQHVQFVYPHAAVTICTRVENACTVLASSRVDLLVAGVSFADGDVFDLLSETAVARERSLRVLIVTSRRGPRIFVSLRAMNVTGMFDCADEPAETLRLVLRHVECGRSYWSATFLASLLGADGRIVQHQLTHSEQLALAIMGEGCDDSSAPKRLGMSFSSIRALRKQLYAKLNVHGREDLMRAASRLGYTRFGADGPRALGLCVLFSEYRERTKRPGLPPGSLRETPGPQMSTALGR